jgi:hypothetical protein
MKHKVFEMLRNSEIGYRIRTKISRWPGYQQMNPGQRGFKIKFYIRTVLSLISESLRMDEQTKSRLSETRALKSQNRGKVLILGNGPSCKNLTIEQIRRFRSLGGKVLVMNDFVRSDLAQQVIVDFYAIVDPEYWKEDSPSIREFRIMLDGFIEKSKSGLTIIQPAFRPNLSPGHNKYIYLDGRNVSGLLKWSQPHRPWGYPASVALMSISCMRYIGYQEIYFAGLDSDSYKNFFVDELNTLYFDSSFNYSYSEVLHGDSTNVRPMKDWPLNNMADVLFAASIFFRDLKRILGDNAVNVGTDKTNDSCPRACLLH